MSGKQKRKNLKRQTNKFKITVDISEDASKVVDLLQSIMIDEISEITKKLCTACDLHELHENENNTEYSIDIITFLMENEFSKQLIDAFPNVSIMAYDR